MNRSAHRRLRRPLAALFAAAAAWLALLTLRPGPPSSVRVLTAARDLPAGTTLSPSDVRPVSLPPDAVPSGALRSAAGRVLAGPMRRGEPVTDARVLGDALLRGYGPDKVATPIRITDAETVRLVRPGDRIDVLAAAPTTPSNTPLTPLTESPDQPPASTDPPSAAPSPADATSALPTSVRSPTPDPPPAGTDRQIVRAAKGSHLLRIRTGPVPADSARRPAGPMRRTRPASSITSTPTGRSSAHEVTRATAVRGAAAPWGRARVVASSVPVITVPPPDEKGTADGALIVLATTRTQALALAGTRTELSVTITAP